MVVLFELGERNEKFGDVLMPFPLIGRPNDERA